MAHKPKNPPQNFTSRSWEITYVGDTRIAKSVAPGKSVWLREIRVTREWFIEKLRPGNSDPEDPDQSEDERGATGQDQFRNRLEHKDVVGA
jgi:hypothetical protein